MFPYVLNNCKLQCNFCPPSFSSVSLLIASLALKRKEGKPEIVTVCS